MASKRAERVANIAAASAAAVANKRAHRHDRNANANCAPRLIDRVRNAAFAEATRAERERRRRSLRAFARALASQGTTNKKKHTSAVAARASANASRLSSPLMRPRASFSPKHCRGPPDDDDDDDDDDEGDVGKRRSIGTQWRRLAGGARAHHLATLATTTKLIN